MFPAIELNDAPFLEGRSTKGTRRLTTKERKLVAKTLKLWDNHKSR